MKIWVELQGVYLYLLKVKAVHVLVRWRYLLKLWCDKYIEFSLNSNLRNDSGI